MAAAPGWTWIRAATPTTWARAPRTRGRQHTVNAKEVIVSRIDAMPHTIREADAAFVRHTTRSGNVLFYRLFSFPFSLHRKARLQCFSGLLVASQMPLQPRRRHCGEIAAVVYPVGRERRCKSNCSRSCTTNCWSLQSEKHPARRRLNPKPRSPYQSSNTPPSLESVPPEKAATTFLAPRS